MILAFTSLFALLSSYLNNMAIFCLSQNCLSDNSNFARAHIAQLVEHFHGKEEVVRSIRTVGTINQYFSLKKHFKIKSKKKKYLYTTSVDLKLSF